jgi:hypothetical protein
MPKEIKWFENCLLFWMFTGVTKLLANNLQMMAEARSHFLLWSFLFVVVSFTLCMMVLVSRYQKRWPAWVLLAGYIWGIYTVVIDPDPYFNRHWASILHGITQIVAPAIALWMVLLTRAGRDWTRKQSKAPQPVVSTSRLGL